MSCHYPRRAYMRASGGSPVYSDHFDDIIAVTSLPCGYCIGCALDHRREWAIRGWHESKMHRENAFLTLTYADDQLPDGENCCYAHVQCLLMRLRKEFPSLDISYEATTEYGERTHRPHAHMALYGFWPWDAKPHKKRNGNTLYRSAKLEELWRYGEVLAGKLTPQSAAYVAAHRLNSLDLEKTLERRRRLDPETGEVVVRVEEEFHASVRPGIAFRWYQKFGAHTRANDFVVDWNGRQQKPPRYYDKLMKLVDPERYEEIKTDRLIRSVEFAPDGILARREVKQFLQIDRLQKGDFGRVKL